MYIIIRALIVILAVHLCVGCSGYSWSRLEVMDGRWEYRKCKTVCIAIEEEAGVCPEFHEVATTNCDKWVKSNKKSMTNEDVE